MSSAAVFIRVAVPVPVFSLYDYRAEVPAPRPGTRVVVSLGRRQLTGVVIQSPVTPDIDPKKIKPIIECLDPEPLLDAHLLKLCQWVARYYHHPLGDALTSALPAHLRRALPAERQTARSWQAIRQPQPDELKRAPMQRAIYQAIAETRGQLLHSDLISRWPNTSQPLKKLVERGLIAAVDTPQSLLAGLNNRETPPLTAQQREVVAQAKQTLGHFQPSIIEGVTGSGKTEVYFQIMAAVLAQGRQVLFLAPEIGLTPQLIDRIRGRFTGQIGLLHSARTDGERANAWLAARAGEADIIVGTRSAICTPLPRLGLIIIDEEHDGSYKQQEGFRYHARDVALKRAQMLDIPIILGSATPALETLYQAQRGHYQHLKLPERANGSQPPKIGIIDVRSRPLEGGLSQPLLAKLRPHLAAGNQALLFINRRGYAPVYMCHDCGWIAECVRCEHPMTLHFGGRRIDCHHCGAIRPAPQHCGQCDSHKLVAVGSGTEQVAASLRAQFPDVTMARFDRDSVSKKGRMEAQLADVANGKTQLLVGTQMLAKGHDFARLTFVGVIDVDGGLFSVDFRAPEHLAQLIVQVAGRAGRGQTPGEVWLQTHHPEHPQLQHLLRHGYAGFAQQALEERKIIGLPPHGHLVLLRAEAKTLDMALDYLHSVKNLSPNPPQVEYWGPVPAPMPKRAGRYRAQLMLHSTQRKPLHQLLYHWRAQLSRLPNANRVRWSIDVDPHSLS